MKHFYVLTLLISFSLSTALSQDTRYEINRIGGTAGISVSPKLTSKQLLERYQIRQYAANPAWTTVTNQIAIQSTAIKATQLQELRLQATLNHWRNTTNNSVLVSNQLAVTKQTLVKANQRLSEMVTRKETIESNIRLQGSVKR